METGISAHREVCVGEVQRLHDDFAGLAQVGVAQVGSLKVGPSQVGAGQLSPAQDGALQVGLAQVGELLLEHALGALALVGAVLGVLAGLLVITAVLVVTLVGLAGFFASQYLDPTEEYIPSLLSEAGQQLGKGAFTEQTLAEARARGGTP